MPKATITFTITGADKIIKLLGELDGLGFLNAVAFAAAKDLKDDMMADMPGTVGQGKARPQWASRAQQVAYLAQRRERGLPLKYTRTSDPMSQQLSQGWNVRGLGANQIGASLGNAATYGPYVMDEEQQSQMHRVTGWPTIQSTVRKHGDAVQQKIEDAIKAKIRAAGR